MLTVPVHGAYQKEDTIIPNELPAFTYHKQDFYDYFLSRLKYPRKIKKEIHGKIMIVDFVVKEDGSVADVEISKSVHPLVDSTAVGIIRDMPKWRPAQKDHKPIAFPMRFPIKFNIK